MKEQKKNEDAMKEMKEKKNKVMNESLRIEGLKVGYFQESFDEKKVIEMIEKNIPSVYEDKLLSLDELKFDEFVKGLSKDTLKEDEMKRVLNGIQQICVKLDHKRAISVVDKLYECLIDNKQGMN